MSVRIYPKGFGGERQDPEEIKGDGWRDSGILVIKYDDPRLAWPERELIDQIGNRLYGERTNA